MSRRTWLLTHAACGCNIAIRQDDWASMDTNIKLRRS
jgi:hypothetical protein